MARRYTAEDIAALGQSLGAALKAPKRRSQEESLMQRSLIRWWKENCGRFGVPECCLFSIPNGGGRSGPVTGSILKAEGLRKGAPDLMLCVPRWRAIEAASDGNGNYKSIIHGEWHHALFLELKRPSGVVSPEQEKFHEVLRAEGYKVVVCRTLMDAINQITNYLT